MRILKRDLDEAMAQPWSSTTCIIAQAFKREYGVAPQYGGAIQMGVFNGKNITYTEKQRELRQTFDFCFCHEQDFTALAMLREMLPITL